MWRNFQILKGGCLSFEKTCVGEYFVDPYSSTSKTSCLQRQDYCISFQGPPKVSKENKGCVTTKTNG